MQQKDGTWRFCFESGILIDAYMIIVLRVLELPYEALIKKLHDRIAERQELSGAWKVYPDEEDGNLDTTVDAYYAMLYSGYSKRTDASMQKAAAFIRSKGGIRQVRTVLTKVFLAATGQYPWPASLMIPLEFLLLPSSAPLSFYDFSGFARVHFAPILIMADRKFVSNASTAPDLSELDVQSYSDADANAQIPMMSSDEKRGFQTIMDEIHSGIKKLAAIPSLLHERALKYAEQYMLDRIESDGTLYSYASSTLLMILSLLSLGYDKRHPVIAAAVDGLITMLWPMKSGLHLQNSPSTIWDTALISTALQQAGAGQNQESVARSIQYLLSMQHDKQADWSTHVPHTPAGGWGFSESNTLNPDVDDTTAALRTIRLSAKENPNLLDPWNRGLNWILRMQNKDGGWPAFEKGVTNTWLTLFPIDGAKSAAIDPSSADLTGRTLEFLGTSAGLDMRHATVRRGVQWLLDNQQPDGSWYGRWGICYLYGTWAALTGLMAVKFDPEHPSVRKAVRWLLQIQNEDGGWGESCTSDRDRHYVPLHASTPSQTAWALDALIAVYSLPSAPIDRGMRRILLHMHQDDWTTIYPTGAALPGSFYTHYHSYRYIWPLMALNHYRRKYQQCSISDT
ncbi:squalene--hopene cyclase [Paenibacillus hexagrammi]|uniref:Squalene--hopene cyclase n=1 Tax=Paenibacillus hexagrammi TaxID=2908839 RepID=A0ABY3SQZ2_9BACL|nr:squalene--hopene cyclase [Paenibacillus sp. YPD9-1]UJF36287.1 squalene--hopene cyclase [Paenibacillus sp. YPD9-1]